MEKMLSPLGGFLGGIIISLTLLPCTSGPYFVATALISKGANVLGGTFLLMLYNAIFVSPFLLITLAFHYGQKSDRWAKVIGGFEQVQRKGKLLDLLVGLLLIAIVLYAYITM
jgi:cytochrome c biogenesis protein CcdA